MYFFEQTAGRVESLRVWGFCGDDFVVFLRIAVVFEFLFERSV
jgi:hypothetical protein